MNCILYAFPQILIGDIDSHHQAPMLAAARRKTLFSIKIPNISPIIRIDEGDECKCKSATTLMTMIVIGGGAREEAGRRAFSGGAREGLRSSFEVAPVKTRTLHSEHANPQKTHKSVSKQISRCGLPKFNLVHCIC